MNKIYTCFPGGKHKVVTLSYDDGKLEDRQLVALFNKYGVKGTFHINSGLFDMDVRIKPDEIKNLYQGHEVACHTLTHPTIERCPLPLVANEVLKDRENLEDIVGYPVRGLSYPNGSYSDEIKTLLPSLGIKYSRIVGSTDGFALPKDFYEWKATCHHNHNLIELAKNFVELKKTQYLYMMYVWGHSYEFSRDDNWDVMEEFLKIVSNQSDTWYATNIDIVDYMEAAQQLRFTTKCDMVYNPMATSIWISVNDIITEIPGGATVNLR